MRAMRCKSVPSSTLIDASPPSVVAAKLVPEACTYEDDVRLPAWRLALTNIVARATRAASRPGVLEHLGIADRIAEGGIRTAADHQLDALGLACVS